MGFGFCDSTIIIATSLGALFPAAGNNEDIVGACFEYSHRPPEDFRPFFEYSLPYVSQRVKDSLSFRRLVFPMYLCRKCGSRDGLFTCLCGEVEQSVCSGCGCGGTCQSAVPAAEGEEEEEEEEGSDWGICERCNKCGEDVGPAMNDQLLCDRCAEHGD